MEQKQFIEPLLYIEQPVFQKPNVRMQRQYYSRETETVQQEERPIQKKKRENVSFRNLSIAEQIQYLIDIPEEVPSLRCEVLTKGKKYRGIIIEEEAGAILLRIFGRESEWIRKDAITSIRLIGF